MPKTSIGKYRPKRLFTDLRAKNSTSTEPSLLLLGVNFEPEMQFMHTAHKSRQ